MYNGSAEDNKIHFTFFFWAWRNICALISFAVLKLHQVTACESSWKPPREASYPGWKLETSETSTDHSKAKTRAITAWQRRHCDGVFFCIVMSLTLKTFPFPLLFTSCFQRFILRLHHVSHLTSDTSEQSLLLPRRTITSCSHCSKQQDNVVYNLMLLICSATEIQKQKWQSFTSRLLFFSCSQWKDS